LAAYLAGGRLSREVMKKCILPGIFFAGSMLSSFASFQHTTIANATLIFSLQPVVMLLVAPRLFGERPTVLRVCLSVVALGGVGLVVGFAASGGEATMQGNLFALLNLLLWSIYFVFAKRVRDVGMHAGSFLAGVFIVSAVVICPWAVAIGADFTQVNGKDWILIAGQVVIPGLIGHTLITWATRFMDITLVSILNLMSPAISMVGAWFIYKQSMVPIQILGAVVMLVSVAVIVRTRHLGSNRGSPQYVVEPVSAE